MVSFLEIVLMKGMVLCGPINWNWVNRGSPMSLMSKDVVYILFHLRNDFLKSG